MKTKICGLTRPEEAGYLNEAQADYAGFVFYEKSKRNLTIERANEIFRQLSPVIQKVAVVVSPDVPQAVFLEQAGFDILQVHKNLTKEVLEAVSIPVWYAFNISNPDELQQKKAFLEELPEELAQKITAIVVDGAQFGSGKTFDWNRMWDNNRKADSQIFKKRLFVLAGGLNAGNVGLGISIFHPDVVDVSSGVEGNQGKDRKLVLEFTERVRTHE